MHYDSQIDSYKSFKGCVLHADFVLVRQNFYRKHDYVCCCYYSVNVALFLLATLLSEKLAIRIGVRHYF